VTSESLRIGEVVEASTGNFIAQSYELYQLPPLGGLVRTRQAPAELYGVVYYAATTGMEPGRRPIARGKDEPSEEDVYRTSPQLLKLLRSEFSALVVGFNRDDKIYHFLPPQPARIHGFVHICTPEEVKRFSSSFDFLNTLLKARLDIPAEELVGACLRQFSEAYGTERRSFLVAAGKELATLLADDYGQLKAILKGLKYDAAG
jgi:hypothetical protein